MYVPKVTFVNYGKTVEFESGKLPYSEHGKPESLLDIALNFGIHLEHACGGNCACTTCHVWVKEGDANLVGRLGAISPGLVEATTWRECALEAERLEMDFAGEKGAGK